MNAGEVGRFCRVRRNRRVPADTLLVGYARQPERQPRQPRAKAFRDLTWAASSRTRRSLQSRDDLRAHGGPPRFTRIIAQRTVHELHRPGNLVRVDTLT